jgi:hypothetical protein
MAKKKKSKSKLSPAMFKVTGANAKLKVDSKKKKLFYFGIKVKPEKAAKVAESDGAQILEVSSSALKVSKPKIKYDFYCTYKADFEMSFLRSRKHETGVNDQVKGVLVGKEVVAPKKSGGFNKISLDLVELFEIKNSESYTIDGRTGGPADAFKKLLKGPGKKKATPAWVKKNKIGSGKYNSIEKWVKYLTKMASTKPSGAKRIITHSLDFKLLNGYYIPVYYVKVTAGAKTQTLKINAVNGTVSLAV